MYLVVEIQQRRLRREKDYREIKGLVGIVLCERGLEEEEGGVGEKRVHTSEIQSTFVWATYMGHVSALSSLFQIGLGRPHVWPAVYKNL